MMSSRSHTTTYLPTRATHLAYSLPAGTLRPYRQRTSIFPVPLPPDPGPCPGGLLALMPWFILACRCESANNSPPCTLPIAGPYPETHQAQHGPHQVPPPLRIRLCIPSRCSVPPVPFVGDLQSPPPTHPPRLLPVLLPTPENPRSSPILAGWSFNSMAW